MKVLCDVGGWRKVMDVSPHCMISHKLEVRLEKPFSCVVAGANTPQARDSFITVVLYLDHIDGDMPLFRFDP